MDGERKRQRIRDHLAVQAAVMAARAGAMSDDAARWAADVVRVDLGDEDMVIVQFRECDG